MLWREKKKKKKQKVVCTRHDLRSAVKKDLWVKKKNSLKEKKLGFKGQRRKEQRRKKKWG